MLRSAPAVTLAVAVAHGVNDAYAAFLHPLLPRIMGKLGIGVALAATAAMTLSLSASVLQPALGYLADRYGRRLFVALGPLLSGVFLSLIGLAPTFAVLLALLVLGGLGSAAFHPPGASMSARVSEGKGSGLRLSIFSFGGSAGYALGPLVAVALVGLAGLEGLAYAMAPGLIVGIVLMRVLPGGAGDRSTSRPPSVPAVLARLRGPLGLVFAISALGAFVQRVFLTMEPIVMAAAGGSEARGAAILSLYLAAQAAGGFAGGYLTDRMDRRALLATFTFLSFPAHILVFWLPATSPGAFMAAAAAGFLNMALLPPIVVTAQELVPEGAAFSSGIVMGLAWAAGSLGIIGTGVLGDAIGPRGAALASMPAMLVATLIALHPALRARGTSEPLPRSARP